MTGYEIGRLLMYIKDPDYKVFIPNYSTHMDFRGTDTEYLEVIDKEEVHIYKELGNWSLEL